MKRFVKYVPKNFVVHGTDYIYFNSKYWYKSYNGKTTKIADQNSARDLVASGHLKEDGPVERSKKVSTKQPELLPEQHTSQYKIKPFVLYIHRDGTILNASLQYSHFDWSNQNIESLLKSGDWIESKEISEELKKKAKQLVKPKKLKDWEKLGIDPNASYCFASSVAVSIRGGYDVIHGNMYKQARLVEKPVGTQLSVEDGMIMFKL